MIVGNLELLPRLDAQHARQMMSVGASDPRASGLHGIDEEAAAGHEFTVRWSSERSLRRIRRPDRWYLAGALLILLAVSFLSYQDWSAFQRSAPQVQHSRELLQEIRDR